MSDLISRQSAVDALCDEYCGGWQDCKHYPKCENLKVIQNLPSAQEWIPCSEETGEGYPKEEGFYYVTEQNYGFYLDADHKQRIAHTSHFRNGDFTDRFFLGNNSNITAWMPLSEPYKGEQ